MLVDGRTLYSALFGCILGRPGPVLEDIERIEVTRTRRRLGAKAVNGVSNDTKTAAASRAASVRGRATEVSEEIRGGNVLGDSGHARLRAVKTAQQRRRMAEQPDASYQWRSDSVRLDVAEAPDVKGDAFRGGDEPQRHGAKMPGSNCGPLGGRLRRHALLS